MAKKLLKIRKLNRCTEFTLSHIQLFDCVSWSYRS